MKNTNSLNDLLDLLTQFKQYDLSQPMVKGMPIHPAHPPYHITLNNRHGDVVRTCGHSSSNEMIVMSTHSGTHIDAICHVSDNYKLYGDIDALDAQRGIELHKKLGAEDLEPVFNRGVLIDVPKYLGVEQLDPAYEISVEDLKGSLKYQNIEIEQNDIILIRTGWGKYWDDSEKYLGSTSKGAPGPGFEAAKWLARKKPLAVGSDTSAFEVMPNENITLEVHMILIAQNGIPIIENLFLEDLSKINGYEFMFISIPIKFVGATGSPIRPLALIKKE